MIVNVLGKVADKLIEIGMNSIFDSKGGDLFGGNIDTLKAPTMPTLRVPAMPQSQASGFYVTLGWSMDADSNTAPIIKDVSQQTFKQDIKQYGVVANATVKGTTMQIKNELFLPSYIQTDAPPKT